LFGTIRSLSSRKPFFFASWAEVATLAVAAVRKPSFRKARMSLPELPAAGHLGGAAGDVGQAAGTGDQAHADFDQTDIALHMGDAARAVDGQLAATAQRQAAHGGHHRHVGVAQRSMASCSFFSSGAMPLLPIFMKTGIIALAGWRRPRTRRRGDQITRPW
jgi:hypothetical protein